MREGIRFSVMIGLRVLGVVICSIIFFRSTAYINANYGLDTDVAVVLGSIIFAVFVIYFIGEPITEFRQRKKAPNKKANK